MEKRLEKMRKEITRQNGLFVSLFLLSSCILTLSQTGLITANYADTARADFISGFLIGLVIVIDFVCILNMVRNAAALKDEKKLTRLYNEKNDERTKQIEALAGGNSIRISMVLLLAIALVASFFSFEAFLALVGSVVVIGLVHKALILYYKNAEL